MSKDWETIINRVKNRNFSPFLIKFYKFVFRFVDHKGIDVVEEDWDHLIVLDACRYDTFKEVNWIEGDLQKKVTKGTGTPEWLRKNFTDYYGDIVYITANGFVSPVSGEDFEDNYHFYPEAINSEKTFHKTYYVFMDDEAQEKGATKPESVTEYGIKADKEYPNKRKIYHYIQPHDPYIAEPSISMKEEDIEDKSEYFKQENSTKAYKENLKRALESVEKLIEELEGKIVITADHGEMFGEKGVYRHPTGVYFKELTEVPWLVIEKGERPETVAEEKDIGGIDV
jgi:hypothetical protein